MMSKIIMKTSFFTLNKLLTTNIIERGGEILQNYILDLSFDEIELLELVEDLLEDFDSYSQSFNQ
jgi:hypothetical protein